MDIDELRANLVLKYSVVEQAKQCLKKNPNNFEKNKNALDKYLSDFEDLFQQCFFETSSIKFIIKYKIFVAYIDSFKESAPRDSLEENSFLFFENLKFNRHWFIEEPEITKAHLHLKNTIEKIQLQEYANPLIEKLELSQEIKNASSVSINHKL